MKTYDLLWGMSWAAFATFSLTVALSTISTDGLSSLAVIFSALCLLFTLISLGVWINGAARAITDQARE